MHAVERSARGGGAVPAGAGRTRLAAGATAQQRALALQRAAGNRAVGAMLAVQRFGGAEHKMMGDVGSRGARVTLAPGLAVSFGDLTALAGDYFGSPEQLKKLAQTPGANGQKAGSVDEVEFALYVKIKSRNLAAPKVTKTERDFSPAVRDAVTRRYLLLASTNVTHFTNPDGLTAPTHNQLATARSHAPLAGDKGNEEKLRNAYGLPKGYSAKGRAVTNAGSYRDNHLKALEAAVLAGQGVKGYSLNDALLFDGFASHFLTDAYSSGHVRTPRAAISAWWNPKVPMFWTNVKLWMAEKTAYELEKLGAYSVATPQLLWDMGEVNLPVVGKVAGAVSTVDAMIAKAGFPDMQFGDIVGKAVHDYDNVHGVTVMVGNQVRSLVGDGVVLDKSRTDVARRAETARLAQEGVKASVDEVQRAFALGSSGLSVAQALTSIRSPAGLYAAEELWPRPLPDSSQHSKSLPWQVPTAAALFQDAQMAKAMRIAANEIAKEMPEMVSLDGDKKVAFDKGVVAALADQNPSNIAKVLMGIVDYTPGSATGSLGGVLGHDEDDNARDYYDRSAKKRDGLQKMSPEARARLIRNMLSGSTTNADENRILGLLASCPNSELPSVVDRVGWRWLWSDLHGSQLGRLIHQVGPRYWKAKDFGAKGREIGYHADGITTEASEEMIVQILKLCSRAQVRSLAVAHDLDWNLDGKEQRELDQLRR